jgi:hypothetical protein
MVAKRWNNCTHKKPLTGRIRMVAHVNGWVVRFYGMPEAQGRPLGRPVGA